MIDFLLNKYIFKKYTCEDCKFFELEKILIKDGNKTIIRNNNAKVCNPQKNYFITKNKSENTCWNFKIQKEQS